MFLFLEMALMTVHHSPFRFCATKKEEVDANSLFCCCLPSSPFGGAATRLLWQCLGCLIWIERAREETRKGRERWMETWARAKKLVLSLSLSLRTLRRFLYTGTTQMVPFDLLHSVSLCGREGRGLYTCGAQELLAERRHNHGPWLTSEDEWMDKGRFRGRCNQRLV